MTALLRQVTLSLYRAAYTITRPLLFRSGAQAAHESALRLMRWLDSASLSSALQRFHQLAFPHQSLAVGGVELPFPLILAAGWVKGDGFSSEEAALDSVAAGRNIIPGWRSMPALVGPVEFGSFTRWPRLGNPGTVLWRDVPTRSTQNRVGLKNPGAKAAAAFLSQHREHLPSCFGINIAVSPGVADPVQGRREVLESLAAFLERSIFPSWFTLNLSCPNTEDDPGGNQTEETALDLCGSVVDRLRYASVDVGYEIPLWVKIGPNLAWEQYHRLMHAFHQVGVRAVVATNTLPAPVPNDPSISAGIAGGSLHACAIQVACELARENQQRGYGIDIVCSGGVLDAASLVGFAHYNIRAVQYLSALIYRGPLAAAVIWNEAQHART